MLRPILFLSGLVTAACGPGAPPANGAGVCEWLESESATRCETEDCLTVLCADLLFPFNDSECDAVTQEGPIVNTTEDALTDMEAWCNRHRLWVWIQDNTPCVEDNHPELQVACEPEID